MRELTSNQYWNQQYGSFAKVDTVRKSWNLSLAELDRYFKALLPRQEGENFIEIGCAPGRWMHYFAKEFKCNTEGIEYTSNGARITRDNLRKLGVNATIHEVDFFCNDLKKESYNKVFSFGFIEHFDDIHNVMLKQWELVARGGYLIVGIPNLRGYNERIQKFYSKDVLAAHNLACMDVELYKKIALENAELIDIRYCGKINLTLFNGKPWLVRFMGIIQVMLTGFYFCFRRKFIPDNPLWSPYIFMIYKKI